MCLSLLCGTDSPTFAAGLRGQLMVGLRAGGTGCRRIQCLEFGYVQASEHQEKPREPKGGQQGGQAWFCTEQGFDQFTHRQGENEGETQDIQGREKQQSRTVAPVREEGQDQEPGHDEAKVQDEDRVEGVNLLAALTKQDAAALGSDFDNEIDEMHHRM